MAPCSSAPRFPDGDPPKVCSPRGVYHPKTEEARRDATKVKISMSYITAKQSRNSTRGAHQMPARVRASTGLDVPLPLLKEAQTDPTP